MGVLFRGYGLDNTETHCRGTSRMCSEIGIESSRSALLEGPFRHVGLVEVFRVMCL